MCQINMNQIIWNESVKSGIWRESKFTNKMCVVGPWFKRTSKVCWNPALETNSPTALTCHEPLRCGVSHKKIIKFDRFGPHKPPLDIFEKYITVTKTPLSFHIPNNLSHCDNWQSKASSFKSKRWISNNSSFFFFNFFYFVVELKSISLLLNFLILFLNGFIQVLVLCF